ncbi:acyltransferase [Neobacillus muris]|uniref:acyltransferase n=1 Tax=Neobacillus muris TaxID=2941334 RepID=UPI00203CD657|nr:acyltransferase [Neobacillus muris]
MIKIALLLLIVIAQAILTSIYARLMRKRFLRKQKNGNTGDYRSASPEKKYKKSIIAAVIMWIDGFIRYKLFLLAYFPSHTWRKIILKYIYGMKMTPKTVLYYGFEIREPWNITIGDSVIGDKCILDGRMGIEIGHNVNLSSGVQIWTLQHSVNDEYFRCLDEGQAVVVEDYVWLSSNVTVLPGVRLSKGSVAASGAVVTKDVEEFIIAGGVPAKPIGTRNKSLMYQFKGKHYHFL